MWTFWGDHFFPPTIATSSWLCAQDGGCLGDVMTRSCFRTQSQSPWAHQFSFLVSGQRRWLFPRCQAPIQEQNIPLGQLNDQSSKGQTHVHTDTCPHTQGGLNLREGFRLDRWVLLKALSASACPGLCESVCAQCGPAVVCARIHMSICLLVSTQAWVHVNECRSLSACLHVSVCEFEFFKD